MAIYNRYLAIFIFASFWNKPCLLTKKKMLSKTQKMKQYFHLIIKNVLLKNTLNDVDEFYRNIISNMPHNSKVNYCESLIFRTTVDLKQCNCKIKKSNLKQLLKASIFELKKLKN